MLKKVMTVDDSPTVLKVLNIALTGAGYQVVEANDGQEAINKLTETDVDLLVTDLNMPHMDGVELIKQVRQKPGNRFMPIIMLTAEAQCEMKAAGKKAGASGWITKPFRPEQLLSVIQMVCPA